jgi:hypothetical protein
MIPQVAAGGAGATETKLGQLEARHVSVGEGGGDPFRAVHHQVGELVAVIHSCSLPDARPFRTGAVNLGRSTLGGGLAGSGAEHEGRADGGARAGIGAAEGAGRRVAGREQARDRA